MAAELSREWPETTARAVLIVNQQITLLYDTWNERARPGDVYALAGHLRTLLHDGAFNRAWGAVWPADERAKPTVVAPDLTALVPRPTWPRVVHAQTAGLAVPGVHLWMPVAFGPDTGSGADNERKATPAVAPPEVETSQEAWLKQVHLSMRGAVPSGLIDQESVPLAPESCYTRLTVAQFLQAPCMIQRGRPISRQHLVKVFANNLGAAHLDWDGKDEDYRLLAEPGQWLRLSSRNPALLEILSIGQILARSQAARLFRERVASLNLDPSLL
ncbi:hypothetical protein [Amycolatopsis sp. lyj-23]|uniref:hypothetical protein n=1 Tax=Amycolatopsis sp. lyj-23 TaxID=2789283 RepID=UPI0039795F71